MLIILVLSFLSASLFGLQLRKFDGQSDNIACVASNSHANLHLRNLLSGKSLSYLESIGEESLYLIDQFGPQSVYRQQYLEQIYEDAPQQLNVVIERSLLKLHRLTKVYPEIDASLIQRLSCEEFGMVLPLDITTDIISVYTENLKDFDLLAITDNAIGQKVNSRLLQKRSNDETTLRRVRALVGFTQIFIGLDIATVAMEPLAAGTQRLSFPVLLQELVQAMGHMSAGTELGKNRKEQDKVGSLRHTRVADVSLFKRSLLGDNLENLRVFFGSLEILIGYSFYTSLSDYYRSLEQLLDPVPGMNQLVGAGLMLSDLAMILQNNKVAGIGFYLTMIYLEFYYRFVQVYDRIADRDLYYQ
ncbi:hypothetical protein MIR68_005544 [Amoeboaphelidium protococcarum]|nr:hypothetical protein MIR68_005544 [Amoeboaphelidium protococcarum]